MALRDQPYLPLYVQDFLTDERLIECSASATGVYIRLMCIMHKSEEYGVILLKQKDKQTDKHNFNFALKLAKYLPYKLDEIENALSELVHEGVIQIEGDRLLQKRMVKDNLISIERSKAGSKGGKKTQFAKAKIKAKPQANTEIESDNEIDIVFDVFWNLYDKKVGEKTKIEKKWNKLTDTERKLAIEYIPKYKLAQPDKQYRKNPETFLNNKSWNDEIVPRSNSTNGATIHPAVLTRKEKFEIDERF